MQKREANELKFTEEEKKMLAAAITKAACGIVECWEILNEIGARVDADWEPNDTSVSDIADHNAVDIDNPRSAESLDPESVAAFFSDSYLWKNQSARTWVPWQLAPDSDAEERFILVNAEDDTEEHPAQVIFETEQDAREFVS